jgi:hypothetical protein
MFEGPLEDMVEAGLERAALLDGATEPVEEPNALESFAEDPTTLTIGMVPPLAPAPIAPAGCNDITSTVAASTASPEPMIVPDVVPDDSGVPARFVGMGELDE